MLAYLQSAYWLIWFTPKIWGICLGTFITDRPSLVKFIGFMIVFLGVSIATFKGIIWRHIYKVAIWILPVLINSNSCQAMNTNNCHILPQQGNIITLINCLRCTCLKLTHRWTIHHVPRTSFINSALLIKLNKYCYIYMYLSESN